MSKRPRVDSMSSNDEPMEEGANPAAGEGGSAGGAASSGSSGGGGGAGRGAPIFPPGRPLKGINTHQKTFTKKFYFKIYANDWQRIVSGTSPNRSQNIVHFGTYIPWQALCMYMSPQEYMETVRGSHYCKIKQSAFELKFKAIRTPFDANSTDAAEANGNLQFEIQRWDGLEMMLPFQPLDFEGRGQTDITPRSTYAELITRLYGTEAFSSNFAPVGDNFKWPATMRERGLSWRPVWNFSEGGFDQTGFGSMYRTINEYISALPVGEYVTDSVNTNVAKTSEGYCFNKTYKPKNGIIAFASSAACTKTASGDNTGRTRINTKIRFEDQVMNQPANPKLGALQYATLFGEEATIVTGTMLDTDNINALAGGTPNSKQECGSAVAADGPYGRVKFNRDLPGNSDVGVWTGPRIPYVKSIADKSSYDDYGFGYNNDMAYYTTANLENYTVFTSNNDPPIHHMESLIIGVVPKVNADGSIVKATLEFECNTSITVDCQDTHPTYVQCAYSLGADGFPRGYIDRNFNDQRLYAGKWQHNEMDVALRDNKYWMGDYGLAAKPLFRAYPLSDPLL